MQKLNLRLLFVSHLIFLVFLIDQILAAKTFPSEYRCQYGDVDCVKRNAENLLSKFGSNGYPEAALPKLEPFHVKRINIGDNSGGAVNLKLEFHDVDVTGLSSLKVQRAVGFEKDPATSKFEMYGQLSKISIKGKYTADGKILILPIKGDGDADITIVEPEFSVKFKPAVQTKDGKTYISVDKWKVLLEPKQVTFKLTNLFNGDEALGSNLNKFLNENWSDVWKELQPSIHTAVGEIVKNILATVFKDFAYDELFTE